MLRALFYSFFFFFNDTATTEIYTLSLHDALPISARASCRALCRPRSPCADASPPPPVCRRATADRKSTRLNSSHMSISYAVFCLKKKKKKIVTNITHHDNNNYLCQYIYYTTPPSS